MSAADAEPVGSIAEEAFKLFRAVAGAAPTDEESSAGTTGHACTTVWCPVCQVVGFVRDNPDAVASVTRSAAELARSVRHLIDTAQAPQEPQ